MLVCSTSECTGGPRLARSFVHGHSEDSSFATQPCIDVAGACYLEAGEAFKRQQSGHDLLSNFSRGLLELLCQLKRNGYSKFTHARVFWLLDHNGLGLELVAGAEHISEALTQLLLMV